MNGSRPTVVPLVDEGLGNSSYLVDLGEGRALVVDPPRDPTRHLAVAEERRLAISHTAETHLHADFVTGSRELAARGATVLAPAAAGIDWPHRGLGDGDAADLGGLRLRALATPGHTPEHLAYLLCHGDEPVGEKVEIQPPQPPPPGVWISISSPAFSSMRHFDGNSFPPTIAFAPLLPSLPAAAPGGPFVRRSVIRLQERSSSA